MYHCLPRNWLLATNKIEVEFRNGSEEQSKKGFGSGFWINTKTGLVFATNRHILDLEYSNEKYVGEGYQLSSVEILTLGIIYNSTQIPPLIFLVVLTKKL